MLIDRIVCVDAFDVIGKLTFSKALGFLEQGRDVDGIIASLERTLDYAGKVRYPGSRLVALTYRLID